MTRPFIDLLTATSRALSGRKDLHFTPGSNELPYPLAQGEHLLLRSQYHDDLMRDEKRAIRGEADRAALVQRYHNPALHRPTGPMAALTDALEIARIDCLASQKLEGVRNNLQQWEEMRILMDGLHRLPRDELLPETEAIPMLLREALAGIAPPLPLRSKLAPWREKLEPLLRAHTNTLRDALPDQRRFAQLLEQFLYNEQQAEAIGQMADASASSEATESLDSQQGEEQDTDSNQETMEKRTEIEPEGDTAMVEEGQEFSDQQVKESGEELPATNRPNFTPSTLPEGYHVFTDKFDEIVHATQLASHGELKKLSQELDERMKQTEQMTRRLANRLQRLLLAQSERYWEYELEEGLINNARLPQAVIAPDFPYLYKQERVSPERETIVTLLIDNSGSMRGRPITIAALSADLLARTLERCGVKVEILGFTTREWRGGDSRKYWMQHGKPLLPGRLNDLRHIIYKAANQPLGRTRRNLALMLKEGILKENIDGEALLWAYQRLMARPERRRILMVISDGAPVDDSTLSLNSGDYLDRHLREVIAMIQTRSPVELLAIGIGHDVSRYYRHAVTINDVDQLGETMLREMTALFSPHRHAA